MTAEEIMEALNVDRRTAEFYAAIEAGETDGDLVVLNEPGPAEPAARRPRDDDEGGPDRHDRRADR